MHRFVARSAFWVAIVWGATPFAPGCGCEGDHPAPALDAAVMDAAVHDAGRDAAVPAPGEDAAVPEPVVPDAAVPDVGGDVVEVALGCASSCARMIDGTLQCWGDNNLGQLGDGSNYGNERFSPVAVVGITDAVEVALGCVHSCARLGNGTVRCWGADYHGQLGDGPAPQQLTSVEVSGISDAVEIALGGATFGGSHSCARLGDGTVRCWGANDKGQLGDGTTTLRDTPVEVSGLSGVVEIELGSAHSCARLDDGTVRCWGANQVGQLGDGSMGTDRLTPVEVSGLSQTVELEMGYAYSCARLKNKTVRCWGNNGFGELGNDSNVSGPMPVSVSGLDDVAEIATGHYHSCARLRGGTLRCWGYNDLGGLGDGTETHRPVPVAVMGLADVAQVSLGEAHSCALLGSGAVLCWGGNDQGQLGDGTGTLALTPVEVPLPRVANDADGG